MTKMICTSFAGIVLALGISACGEKTGAGAPDSNSLSSKPTVATAEDGHAEDSVAVRTYGSENASNEWNESDALTDLHNETMQDSESDEVLAGVPYPVYPNGSKYRVGGENGLRIVLFQTEDEFAKVDAFYRSVAEMHASMPRLSAMTDYVRYGTYENDNDPWETSKPGIVIHEFSSETEREAVGASQTARTNIIMSFE